MDNIADKLARDYAARENERVNAELHQRMVLGRESCVTVSRPGMPTVVFHVPAWRVNPGGNVSTVRRRTRTAGS